MATAESPPPRAAPAAAVHTELVLIRHGESTWNRSMRLTGWADVPLTERGRQQATRAGAALRARGLGCDLCLSSRLRRATETRDLLLAAHGGSPDVRASWRLNERHYGALQGLYPWQAAWRHGLGSLLRCRRDLAARPPRAAPAASEAPSHLRGAERAAWLRAAAGESLADALTRFLPLWDATIAPALVEGNRVWIVAHNNILRALIAHLDDADLPAARLRTAQPWVLELDRQLRPIRRLALP